MFFVHIQNHPNPKNVQAVRFTPHSNPIQVHSLICITNPGTDSLSFCTSQGNSVPKKNPKPNTIRTTPAPDTRGIPDRKNLQK